MQNPSKRIIFDSNIWISFAIGKRLSELKIAFTHSKIEVFVCKKLLWEVKVTVQKPKLLKYISPERQKMPSHNGRYYQTKCLIFYQNQWNRKSNPCVYRPIIGI